MPITAPSVVDRLASAMSLGSLQHQLTANNIANRDTPGYQRMKLRFDSAMGHIAEARFTSDRSQQNVSMEQDLIDLSSNATRYQAIARVLNRYFSIAAVITGQTRS